LGLGLLRGLLISFGGGARRDGQLKSEMKLTIVIAAPVSCVAGGAPSERCIHAKRSTLNAKPFHPARPARGIMDNRKEIEP
jgi:hypothetical protein